MDCSQSSRTCIFLSFTFIFHFAYSGILTAYITLPITIVAVFVAHALCKSQLPPERLIKFATLFDLSFELPELSTKPTDGPHNRIVLHRGGLIDAPENTVEAVREAAKQGAAGVEIDLHFTADGVGVALHDENLARTTSGNGSVHDKSFVEIQALDAAAQHPSRTKFPKGSVKIPKLKEVLLECLQHKLLVFIDCKDNCPKTVQLIDTLFTENPELYSCAVMCSFYPHFIYNMRKKNPEVITALIYRKFQISTEVDCVTPRPQFTTGSKRYLAYFLDYLNMWITYAWTWRLCGNSFILLNKESVCWNEVQYWKNLGIHILPWTVNSELEKQFFMEHLNLPVCSDGLQSNTSKECSDGLQSNMSKEGSSE